jgi:flagellar biosynthetic protein FliR
MDAGLVNFVPGYLPALARVGGIMVCAPLLSSAAVPGRVRALLALGLTLGLMPTIGQPVMPNDWVTLAIGVSGEALIGVAIGLAMNLILAAAKMAGELIAQQLGLGLSEMFDPHTGGDANVLGHAYAIFATVVFLGVNGHHALIRGIGASFAAVPVMSAFSSGGVVTMLSGMLLGAMSLALQLAMPIFVTMLIVDLAVGMVGRSAPQVGMMTAAIALRSLVGLIVLVLCMAATGLILQGATSTWMQLVQNALPGLVGR